MPDKLTLATEADAGFESSHKAARRDVFLAETDEMVPQAQLCTVIEPQYPKASVEVARCTNGTGRMWRIQWYFGVKVDTCVDTTTGLVHHVVMTAANVADVPQIDKLLHGREKAVFGDAGYLSAARDAPARRGRRLYIAARCGTSKAIAHPALQAWTVKFEQAKASVRTAVEHPFLVIKRKFGHLSALSWVGQNWCSDAAPVCVSDQSIARKHLLINAG